MRLFVAIDLPQSERVAIHARLEAVSSTFPPARWLSPELWHLTLHFQGETAPELLPDLRRALESSFAGSKPVRLTPRGVGAFPPRGPARVLWVGLEAGEELLEMQRRVVEAVVAVAGGRVDGRPFRPHVTVARLRRPWPPRALERWRSELADLRGGEFVALEGCLKESVLDPAGVRYRTLAAYPMRQP